METGLIHSLTDNFEAHAQQTEGGVEFWLARDLQHLLGYSECQKMQKKKSKKSFSAGRGSAFSNGNTTWGRVSNSHKMCKRTSS
ncbi:MAG: hypothetical protein WA140_07065 [Geobacteraceae bacterium]